MLYDHLPIVDVFRRLDAQTLLGVMDARGISQPFFFTLRHEGGGGGPTPRRRDRFRRYEAAASHGGSLQTLHVDTGSDNHCSR
ncbi:MAG: DUF4334 domain-containing protein [Cyanobium sp. D14.bin.5]|nr:DUF4334 domain-containing protein [Cyanobium sp. D14.bin.5]